MRTNNTSFTSIESEGNTDKMDSSSTAHLTLNAVSSSQLTPVSAPPRGSTDRSTDQSVDLSSNGDGSPGHTVTVIGCGDDAGRGTCSGGSHQRFNFATGNHANHTTGQNAARFLNGGISFVQRLHLTKHKRTLWSRATPLEKLLMLAVTVLSAASILLSLTLVSVIVTQSNHRHNHTVPHDEDGREFCLTPDCVKVAASVIEAIDNSVDPCDDFYMYSCGDWIKSNPLPDGKSNWGTFSKLWQDNQAIMRSVLEEETNFKPGSAEEKAKIYYESCLDKNDTVEARGTKPMQDLIASAGGWNITGSFDSKEWDLQSALQIYHNQYNRGGLFSWAVGADERNSTHNIIQLDQGSLGLPSRDYYLNKTDKNILDAYLVYMIKVAELMGGTNAEEQMNDVFEFEKKLAAITVPQDQRRDDERMYHKYTLRELNTKAPFLNWTKYFDDAFEYHSKTTISSSSNFTHQTDFNQSITNQTTYSLTASNGSTTPTEDEAKSVSGTVNQESQKPTISAISKHKVTDDENVVIYAPEYFEDLSQLLSEYRGTERGKVTLANYLAWSVIQSLIATLPKNFRDASRILRRTLIGSEGIEVSWRYCVTDTNQVMGFALGSLFVRRVFQGQSKERAEEMIFSIRNAFKDNLPNLNWMDDRTRMLAREKADHINQMIGFPDFILSPEKLNDRYEGLELDGNNYFENNIKVNVLSLRENMEKINKPANKTEWEMTPPMVNAYYTPTKNQIVFPAGILQTPFYDLTFPNSLNYGAMGVVMGHELTHAFDDQGREYDKDGNLDQWWNNETLKNFEERVKCFVDQYSSYKVDDNYLNGKQTLGENIADNGGLKAAFRAYEKWTESHIEPRLPGLNLTSKQLFFVGFAQVWCSTSTAESLKLQILNDPHAPAQFRVIGTLSNSDEFAREFSCPEGSKMNPEKKCIVW